MTEDAHEGDLSAAEDDGLELTVFENIVPQTFLDEMNAAIDATRETWPAAHGGPNLPVADACAKLLRSNKAFRTIEKQTCCEIRKWMRKQSGLALANESIASLRCVNHSMPWQAHLRHFDSHLLTLLIPIQLADGAEQNGDLLLYVQRRKYASMLSNVIRKIWLVIQQNRRYETRRRYTSSDLAADKCRRIACVPGHVYAFNGFVTLHANLHVTCGERRTLVLHYFDTKLTVRVKNVTLIWNSWRERVMRWGMVVASRVSE